jgi:rhodanese-related sulfurtransferase
MAQGMNRRTTIIGLALTASLCSTVVHARPAEIISARKAAKLSEKNALLIIDIRTPSEWRRTGIAVSAWPLSELDPQFSGRLLSLVNYDRGHPIALICARGGRSARLRVKLKQAGFTRVLDIAEGMSGSGWGPGWLAQNLPIKRYLTP